MYNLCFCKQKTAYEWRISDWSSDVCSSYLGESYIGLQPGGDLESLKPGEEIAFTTPAVDIIQMVGKYMFSGGGDNAAAAPADAGDAAPQPPPPTETPHPSPPRSFPYHGQAPLPTHGPNSHRDCPLPRYKHTQHHYSYSQPLTVHI